MLEMLKARKEQLQKQGKKGFTLMEMLIVIAIIAVLIAIAIPIFTNQLEKSREATDVANVRSAYAEVVAKYIEQGTAQSMEVKATQTIDGWQTTPEPKLTTQIEGTEGELSIPAKTDKYTVSVTVDASTGTPTIAVA